VARLCWCVWPFLELESVVLVAFLAVPGLCRFLNVTRRRWIATSDVRQQSTLLDVNTHWHDELRFSNVWLLPFTLL